MLGSWRKCLIIGCDQVPGGQSFPGWDSHHIVEGGRGQGLLDRVENLRLDGIDVSREVVDEVILWQPDEAPLVDELVNQGRRSWALREQRAEGFSLVKSEGGDVDETGDIRRVRAERGDDLTAVGVANQDGWTVLQRQQLEPSAHAPWTRMMFGRLLI